MKPSPQQLNWAVGELGMLRYFPSDAGARAGIMGVLARMVETVEGLQWLVRTMVDEVGEWQGPKELRGVYCTRFRPADGIESWCAQGKFSPEAIEGRAALESAGYRSLPTPNLRLLVQPESEEPVGMKASDVQWK